MLKMVDGTGIIGVDMICPLGVSTPQPPNYDRVELEGAGMLVLPNSLDAPLERLELGGKTDQVQTTGKNLLPDKFSIYVEGKSKTNLKLQIGNYVYSSKTSKNLYILHEDKSNITNGWTATNKFNFKIDKEETIEVRIETENPLEILPMIREETELDSYEPYTGGKPSPSPEYPQEIKSVGKWNDEKQKYEVEISISGRNLFDFSTCEEGKIFEGSGNIVSTTNGVLTDFIPCFPNSQYSRSRTGSTVVAFYDCNKNKIGFEIVGNTTFVTPEKCRYFRFSAVKTQVDYTKIVACPGNTVMDYEPYKKPQSLTLTSDRPITKWDRLVEQGGQIGWLYNSANETIDGKTGKWSIQPATKIFYRTDITFPIVVPFCIELLGYDYLMGEYKKDTGITINNLGILCITLPEEVELTLDAYKQYLADNPLHVLYKGDSEEFVPLSESEQNAIRALKTYYPTTVITADGGELDPDIKVTYRKEK